MSLGKDKEERYKDYLDSGGKKDSEEWNRIENAAEDIASGWVVGTFCRDEEIWERVKEIRERE